MKSANKYILFFENQWNKNSLVTLAGYFETTDSARFFRIEFHNTWHKLTERLNELTASEAYIICGLSFTTAAYLKQYTHIRELIVRFGTKVCFIAGGPHASAYPEMLINEGFQFVFTGEAEQSFEFWIQNLIKSDTNYMHIPGLVWKDATLHKNDKTYNFNLDKSFPVCNDGKKIGYLEVARGCPFSCYFCQTAKLFGTTPRYRSIENIVSFANFLKKQNFTDIRILSPNALGYGSECGFKPNYHALESMLAKLREKLGSRGRIFFGNFPSECRPEFVDKKTIGILKKYVSNKSIIIGAQSGSDELLKKSHRGHSVGDVVKAVEEASYADFEINLDFIFGLPGEKEHDQLQTIELMKNIHIKFPGVRFHIHSFMPLPQTRFESENLGIISDKIIRTLDIMIGHGVVYGPWKNHEHIARSFHKFQIQNRQ